MRDFADAITTTKCESDVVGPALRSHKKDSSLLACNQTLINSYFFPSLAELFFFLVKYLHNTRDFVIHTPTHDALSRYQHFPCPTTQNVA